MAQHPITVPSDLLELWMADWFDDSKSADELLNQAAQYGADQELEACVEWLKEQKFRPSYHDKLRTTRRPKPPSLKEQALDLLKTLDNLVTQDTIRRALELLPDD
jgi:HEPN domain-containing protein